MVKQKGYVVILAGGSGTRLWPISRKNNPKQFLKLFNSKTLFQQTFERVNKTFESSHIFVVTSKEFVTEIKSEVPEILEQNILVEPSQKNTAAAIGLAAVEIKKRDPHAIISTIAADLFIKERTKFLELLVRSQKAAAMGDYIVTIGTRPSYAHIGLGYMRIKGEAFRIGGTPIFKVANFKEKPDVTTAQAYFASGEFFWNVNINSYRVDVILGAIKKYSPVLSIVLSRIENGDTNTEIQSQWSSLPANPVDTAILEKAKNVLMVPGNFFWVDVGDWSSVYSILSTKAHQNVKTGKKVKHIAVNSEGCLVHSSDRLVATVGVRDLLIIDTKDALLICQKDNAQSVSKIVKKITGSNKRKYL